MVYEGMDPVKKKKKLRSLREEKNETAGDLSSAINVSESAIFMYEAGKRIPRDEIKIRIAEHFAMPVESIFFPNKQHEAC